MTKRLLLPRSQAVGLDGRPLAGAKLYTYETGTSTPKSVYSDAALTVAHANPVIADAAGRFPAMFLAAGDYRTILTDADGVTIATDDPVEGDATTSDPAAGVFTSINGGPLGGLRNYILNGDFQVHQRGATSVTADGSYPADRWRLGLTGDTATALRAAISAADAAVLTEDEAAAWALQVAATGGVTASNYVLLLQRIEGVRRLAGKTVTVSFLARRTAGNGNLALDVTQDFGSGGSPSASVGGVGAGQFTLSASFQRFSRTIEIPSVAGKTLGTNDDDHTNIVFWLSAGSDYSDRAAALGAQTITVQIMDVQLEVGTVATTFERRPFSLELALCQRYYAKTFPYDTEPAPNAGLAGALVAGSSGAAGFGATWTYPAEMRAVPTLTTYNPSAVGSGWRDVTNSTDQAPAPSNATGTKHADILAATSDADTAYNYIHITAEAEL